MAGGSLHTLPQSLKLGVSLNGLLGEGIIEPPVDQRRHGGEAGGDELLELGIVDGQQRLARGAEQLICQGEAQHRSAGQSTGGDGAVGRVGRVGRVGNDMCVHSLISFSCMFVCF